jgi:2,3-bisphosphoglycerate-independent phosphoglycerate mutase
VYIHVIGDGRDSPPQEIKKYLTDLENKIKELGIGTIASVIGRFYAMDRDNRWDRIEKAYNSLVLGEGNKAKNWQEAVNASYSSNIFDEFIEPANLTDDTGNPIGLIQDNDAVIFYNFRIDRPRELTKSFVLNNFESLISHRTTSQNSQDNPDVKTFNRKKKLNNLFFVTMTEYEKGLPVQAAFPPLIVKNSLGEVLSTKAVKQLRMAESEKERFVTFYFNGLQDKTFIGEDRTIVPSPLVQTYDLKPEMSAYELTDKLIEAMNSKPFLLFQ